MSLIGTHWHPKGPNLRRLREIKLDLSGTQFMFRVPLHSEHGIIFRERPSRYNLYDPSAYEQSDLFPGELSHFSCYSTAWKFTGLPGVQGRLGVLEMGVGLYHFPNGTNLFRPNVMEEALEAELAPFYGPESKRINSYRSRCNWQVISINGNEWLYFEIIKIDPRGSESRHHRWSMPTSKEHFLVVSFRESAFGRLTMTPGLKRQCARLRHLIMESTQLTLSPSAQAEKAEAAAQWPDESYSESLPELWPEKGPIQTMSDFEREIAEIKKRYK